MPVSYKRKNTMKKSKSSKGSKSSKLSKRVKTRKSTKTKKRLTRKSKNGSVVRKMRGGRDNNNNLQLDEEFKEFIKQYCITEYDYFTEEKKILFAQLKEDQILNSFGVITLDEFKNFFNTKDKEWFLNHNITIGFYNSFERFIPKHNQMINQEQL
jgi:hypothetical protein